MWDRVEGGGGRGWGSTSVAGQYLGTPRTHSAQNQRTISPITAALLDKPTPPIHLSAMPLDALATNIPKRPGVPGDGSLGRQDFAKFVARIFPTITEESKVAFAQWVHSTPTRIDRTKWWMDAYPPVRKLNHWGRLDLVDKIQADPIVRAELDRLALEDAQSGVMTQRQRRQKLNVIASTTEHPTRGYTDHIKAMELDAKLDGTLGKSADAAAAGEQRLPALNLFFLNTAEVKPAIAVGPTPSTDRADLAISQWTLDVPAEPESTLPDPDDIL